MLGGIGVISWEFVSVAPRKTGWKRAVFSRPFLALFFWRILMVIAVVPVGVLTAVYLQEYTDPQSGITRLLRIAINNLAGVPSIVFGLFGLGFFIAFVGGNMDKLFHAGEGPVWGQPAILWASLTMALLTLPVVIVSTGRSAPGDPSRTEGSELCAWRHQIADDLQGDPPPGDARSSPARSWRWVAGPAKLPRSCFYRRSVLSPYLPSKLSDQFMVQDIIPM